MGSGVWKVPSRSDIYTGSVDASLFSVSLPVLPQGQFDFVDSIYGGQSVDVMTSDLNGPQEDVQGQSSLEEVGRNHIGSILPGNEEELLAGIMDGFNLSGLPNQMEDLEEYDIFRSGGAMEMDSDPQGNLIIGMSRVSLSDAAAGDGSNQSGLPNSVGTVVGEHPYGEHPSKFYLSATLIVT